MAGGNGWGCGFARLADDEAEFFECLVTQFH